MRFTHHFPTFRIPGGMSFAISLILVFLFLPSGVAAAERQTIHVHFGIEGEEFDNLPTEGRSRIKADVAEKFSTAAEKRWGFIDWSPGPPSSADDPAPPPSADDLEWKITLRLQSRNLSSETGGTSTGFVVSLEHSGFMANRMFPFAQSESNETLYPLGSIIPFQNATDLGDDISRQLDRQIGVLLQSQDVQDFLKQVPIVNEVIADNTDTRIVIPVKIRDLRSKQDSVLDIEFIAANSQIGHLTVKTAAEVLDGGQYHGYVIGRVTDLLLFPIDIATPTWWDPQLFTVINSASDFKVYMISYSPSLAGDSATDGDVVLDPDM